MKSKRLLLTLLMALLVPWAVNAQSVQVGDGTSTSGYLPSYSLYNYSVTQQIYTADEIAASGNITSIAFYNGGTEKSRQYNIYMAHTTKTAFESASDWIALSDANKVYEGTAAVAMTAGAWTTFTLDTPFAYNGTDNLVIGVLDLTGSWQSGMACRVFSTTSTQAIYKYQDAGAYGIDGTYNGNAVTGTLLSLKNQIVLGGIQQAYPAPSNLTVSGQYGHGAILDWTENGTATSWKVAYKKSTDENFTEISVTSKPYTLTGLDPQTTYNVKVCSVYPGRLESNWSATVNFTTTVACPAPTDLLVTLTPNDATIATLSWTEPGQASDWVLEYGTAADFAGATSVNVSGRPEADLTGLTPETVYYARVKAACGGDDGESAWTSTSFEPTTKLVIGSGTSTNSNVPTTTCYNYSLSQQIYTAAELGEASYILSIDFYSSNGATKARNFDIYMVSTNKTSFESTTDWIAVTAANLVYSATNYTWQQGWNTIELDAPFNYDGTSNVAIVMCDEKVTNYECSTNFRVFEATGQAIYARNDDAAYDPFDTSITAYGLLNVKNQIRLLKGVPPTCAKPTGLTVNYTGGTQATVSWTSDATAWNMKVNGTPVNATITNPYTLTGLELATTYEVEVQANCGADGTSEWAGPVSFTTDACMPENQCALTITLTDAYGDGGGNIQVVDAQTDEVLGTYTNSGASTTYTLNVCDGRVLNFIYTSTDSWPYENGWVITDINDDVISEHVGCGSQGSCEAPTNGTIATYTMNCTVTNCRKPTDVIVTQIGKRSALLSWTENGEARAWNILVNSTLIENVTENPYTLSLQPATTYTVSVCPVCEVEKWSDEVTFTTLEACPAPTALNVDPLTPISATLNWTGDASGYNVQYRPVVHGEVYFSDGFEQGFNNWTLIDADGDGFNWKLGSSEGNFGSHSDADCVVSQSCYSEDGGNTWIALTPDNYMVSPLVSLDGTVTFWASGQDANYAAEHFGVAVSTASNDDPDDFTTIQEWTMTAKGTGAKTTSTRSGNRVHGAWYEFTVDLSDYAGQQGYVAIRHFGSSDMFYLDVDDVIIEGPVNNTWTEATASVNHLDITGLTPETEYEWRVMADCDTDGESNWSAIATFTTPSACDAPFDLEVTDRMPTSVTLNWTGYQTGYNIRYREAGVNWEQVDSDKTATGDWTEYSFNLSSFAGQSGYVAIRHYNVSDQFMLDVDDITYNGTTYNFDDSQLPTGWTTYDLDGDGFNWVLGSACGGVYLAEGSSLAGEGYNDSDDLIVSGSYTNIDLDGDSYGDVLYPDNWLILPYGDLGGTLSFYAKGQDADYADEVFGVFVFVGEEYGFENNNPWITIEGVDNPYDLPGLSENTGYEWQVQGINRNCDGELTEWSEVATFHTPGACDALEDLTVEDLTATSISLSWTGYQESYLVQYRTAEVMTDVIFEDAANEQGDWTTDNLETNNDEGYASGWDLLTGYFTFIWTENPPQTLISPELTIANNSTLAFDYAVYSDSYAESFKVGFSTTDNNVSSFTWGEEMTVNNGYFKTYYAAIPDGAKYFAIQCTSDYQFALILDNFVVGQYVPAGEWQPITVNGYSVTIDGLTPETKYDLTVQGICGENEYTAEAGGYFWTLEQTNLTQVIELGAGQNYVSLYVDVELADLQDAVVAGSGANRITIGGQGGNTTWNGRRWNPQTIPWDVMQMYIINVPAACEITLEGMPIDTDPAVNPIEFGQGTNYLGYPFNVASTITDAFAGFAVNGDKISNQSGTASYARNRWSTNLPMEPGMGYLFESSQSGDRPFVYPAPTGSKAGMSQMLQLNPKANLPQMLRKNATETLKLKNK